MPILHVTSEVKFGILSKTVKENFQSKLREYLNSTITNKNEFIASDYPWIVTNKFVEKYKNGKTEKQNLSNFHEAFIMLNRTKRRLSNEDKTDVSLGLIELTLLMDCSPTICDYCYNIAIWYFNSFKIQIEIIPALFYFGICCIHSIMEKTTKVNVITATEIKLINITEMVFYQLYCCFLTDHLKDYDEFTDRLVLYYENFKNSIQIYSNYGFLQAKLSLVVNILNEIINNSDDEIQQSQCLENYNLSQKVVKFHNKYALIYHTLKLTKTNSNQFSSFIDNCSLSQSTQTSWVYSLTTMTILSKLAKNSLFYFQLFVTCARMGLQNLVITENKDLNFENFNYEIFYFYIKLFIEIFFCTIKTKIRKWAFFGNEGKDFDFTEKPSLDKSIQNCGIINFLTLNIGTTKDDVIWSRIRSFGVYEFTMVAYCIGNDLLSEFSRGIVSRVVKHEQSKQGIEAYRMARVVAKIPELNMTTFKAYFSTKIYTYLYDFVGEESHIKNYDNKQKRKLDMKIKTREIKENNRGRYPNFKHSLDLWSLKWNERTNEIIKRLTLDEFCNDKDFEEFDSKNISDILEEYGNKVNKIKSNLKEERKQNYNL